MSPMSRTRGAVAVAGLSAALAHLLPVAVSLRPVRMSVLPALAGIGTPGHVALTFDDGPHPGSTPAYLRLLDQHRVRATFFVLGSKLAAHPGLGRDITAAGHEIALHGWTHRCLLRQGPAATYRDLARGGETITEVTGQRPRWFRAPYGVFTGASLGVAALLGLRPVLWTSWGVDWTSRATGSSVLAAVTRQLVGGGTVLLHDGDASAAPGAWRATVAALPGVLDLCRRRGLSVGPLCEHAVGATAPRRRPSRTP
ncbi:polysaccharide deacetylase family protein [Goodfellowiella coeruleoviolacea]|uniref:Peptidoglycan/xylan/chitin deacetylase, PgdA/CDA1 family n=1 Tax=Goodfellowiella coeruleoviolacea TaxID=334858 RepID=A0AAE3GG54_9PSEU|nr:polysaccharide deacetylase family protein [Goodfellowiella coeruleoviolacea]MCP2167611.1 Peptidoglycan/xylan/chitin deacetylase, PgdA/CDA1 family [Goodfellowiella coeruleoviolacea]